MNKTKINDIFQNVSSKIIMLMVSITPLFFLPITTEFYSLNKQALLLVFSIILSLIFILNLFKSKGITIIKSSLDIPLVIFFVVTILSTIFSINVSDSFFGSTGRWFPSLLGITIIGTIYYLVLWSNLNHNQIRKVLISFIASITINSLVSIISYYEIYFINANYIKVPNFTLTGSTVTTTIIASISILLSLGFYLYSKNKNLKIFLLITSIINLLVISILNTFAGWAVLVTGIIAFFIIIHTQKLKNNKILLASFILIALFFAGIKNYEYTSSVISNKNFPYEVTLPINFSWNITTGALTDSPLLGTGPSTFYLNYTLHKPTNINGTQYWNIRFDKPYNEVLNIVTEMGLLGLISSILIIGSIFIIIRSSVLNSDNQELSRILAVTVIASLSVFIFTYASTLTSFLGVLFLALLITSLADQKNKVQGIYTTYIKLSKGEVNNNTEDKEIKQNIKSPIKLAIITPIIIVVAFITYFFARNYIAEFYTRMSVYAAQNNKWQQVYELQEKAIKIAPTKDVLYNRHAQTILILANSIAAQPEITDEDRSAIIELVAQAVNVARYNTENVNNLNVRNWETQAIIFRNIFQAVEDADDWAITSYNIATSLDPNNPRLRLDLGGIYYATQDYLSAASQFNQAITLKPDYANAHYNFAQALYLLGDYNNAKKALETTLQLLPTESEDAEKVIAEIEIINDQIENLSQSDDTDKPTLTELQAIQNKTSEIEQEPINNVGDQEPELTTEISEEILQEVEQTN